jgi:dolichyl-diphosphooligosaccharide--protein glycosyltransferase
VSEHQPTTWSSYFTDLHAAALLAPAGLVACFLIGELDDAALFLVLYGVTSVYFSGVMVRLMLVLAPAACVLAGLGLSGVIDSLCASLKTAALGGGGGSGGEGAPAEEAAAPSPASKPTSSRSRPSTAASSSSPGFLPKISAVKRALPSDVAAAALAAVAAVLVAFLFHSAFVAAEMYSAPSIVMQSRGNDGTLHVFDDFREAYGWLRHNTPRDAKVASWWDYGYQTTAMADRVSYFFCRGRKSCREGEKNSFSPPSLFSKKKKHLFF